MENKADYLKKIDLHLEQAKKYLEYNIDPSPDKRLKILKSRAREFAKDPREEKFKKDSLELVMFQIYKEKYAIEANYISEVFSLNEYTPIPCTPSFVLGVINVRGKIVSLVNLKNFFGCLDDEPLKMAKVVIVTDSYMEFGIVADVILGNCSSTINELKPFPITLDIQPKYLKGMLNDCLVLDIVKLLSEPALIIQEEIR